MSQDAPRSREPLDNLLKQLRDRVEADWQRSQDIINNIVRLQTAKGLAPDFLKRKRPYETDEVLASAIRAGLLDKAAFVQKPPYLLHFYRRLLSSFRRPVESILEIGVKGGGSTALWKELFPDATVVGMDLKLQRWLTTDPPQDGVVYVQGDQSDEARLAEIAAAHGPFDLVIDDGSHISDHQVTTLRALLRHVRPGGCYVIEDVHSTLKPEGADYKGSYGEDIWGDFVLTVFNRMRFGPQDGPEPTTNGGRLAIGLIRQIDDLIVAKRVLAVRIADRDA